MIERRSDHETRRDRERELVAAASGEERAAARLRLATAERRRGELDLAALAVEQALREGASPGLAAAELASILASDTSEAGARRALACFSAVRPEEGGGAGPFPLVREALSVALLAKKAAFFRDVFRLVPDVRTRALARALGELVSGEVGAFRVDVRAAHGHSDWALALGREVDGSSARALDDLYGRLLESRRYRLWDRLDTPGPLREVGSNRFRVAGGTFELALADTHLALAYRDARGPERLVLYEERPFAGELLATHGPVLAGSPADLEPRVVASAGGTYVAGIDREAGEVLVSFSAFGRNDVALARKRVGRRVRIAAVCPCARGLAVFLAPAARAFTVSAQGEVSRERRLGAGLEVLGAASHGGGDVCVLARRATDAILLRLDEDLRVVGEPERVPRLRAPVDARLEWPTHDLLLVLDPPEVAHAFGADERKLAWTARLALPLDDLTPVSGEALELLAFGAIESEWGLEGVDVGLARWTRDGLGRHGRTVRVETSDPSRALESVRVATQGGRVALATRTGSELTLRTLELLATPARVPPPEEWTYSLGERADEDER
jgi:hypothetical protein